jgi:hypothetical protein
MKRAGRLRRNGDDEKRRISASDARAIWRDLGRPDVDLEQLRIGIEIEQEHTDDLRDAGRIALDHLNEFSDYYTRLTKMEARAKAGLPPNPQLHVKLTRAQEDLIGEFDNINWLIEVGLTYQDGTISGDRDAMRMLLGAYEDRADPDGDWDGIGAPERRTARAAVAKIRKAMTPLTPNGPMLPRARECFDECFDVLSRQFPDFGELELHHDEAAGGDNGHGSERQFGFCTVDPPFQISFAQKIEGLPDKYIRGLMRHEMGHALDHRYGTQLPKLLGKRLPESVERRADMIAEHVFGDPVRYGDLDVQCVQCEGKPRRPRRLG